MALAAPSQTVRCPDCSQSHVLPAGFAGAETRCPGCGKSIRLQGLGAGRIANDETQDMPAGTPSVSPASLASGVPLGSVSPPVPADAQPQPAQAANDSAEAQPDPLLNTVLGKCQIEKRLGEGGMGTVYRARHLSLDVDVAVKVLAPALAQRDRTFVERFLREARTAAQIHHPNIVQVLDVDFQKGFYFIVMEFVDGETAGARMRRKRRLSEREVIKIGMDMATALEYARRRSIIHRDVKPENILISNIGEVKISDLGLAKRGESGSGLTLRDQALGTPSYISPEQATNAQSADHRSDLYSLGTTLFHLATGRPPFEGTSAFHTMMKHLNEPAPEIRAFHADLSLDLAAIVKRLLQKDPRDRYQTAGQLFLALRDQYERLVPRAERDAELSGLKVLPSEIAAPPAPTPPEHARAVWEPERRAGVSPPVPPVTPRPARPETPAPYRPEGGTPSPQPAIHPHPSAVFPRRPSRLWQLCLFIPFANSFSFLWVGALAHKAGWTYGGLGLLAFQSAFLYIWDAWKEKTLAPIGFGVVFLGALLYGLSIRREFESRAVEWESFEEKDGALPPE